MKTKAAGAPRSLLSKLTLILAQRHSTGETKGQHRQSPGRVSLNKAHRAAEHEPRHGHDWLHFISKETLGSMEAGAKSPAESKDPASGGWICLSD